MNIIDIHIIIYLNFKKNIYFSRTLISITNEFSKAYRYNDNKFKCLG